MFEMKMNKNGSGFSCADVAWLTAIAWVVALLIVSVVSAMTSTQAHAADVSVTAPSKEGGVSDFDIKMIKAQFKTYTNQDVTVRKADALGLYEVDMGGQTYFTDASSRYLIVGHMLDPVLKVDLTDKRMKAEASKTMASEVDKVSFVVGDPNAKQEITLFTDPDCPYCRRVESELHDLKGVRIKVVLFPLVQIHPHAMQHARAIWCAKDRQAALEAVMLNGEDLTPDVSCQAPIEQAMSLAQKLGINGTPVTFREDGQRWQGAYSRADLLNWLSEEDGKTASASN